ncbi:MAG: hypothetical protein JWO94_1288 [Verrucomicrobiaceae bacterium]|nr:hypothetical protein [Verrucomicrobiaceae bacterium]
MLQQWNIRSRAHECAVSGRPFEDGEKHYTAIYIDPETGGYSRRDIAFDAWEQEVAERQPFSFWKSVYTKNIPDERPEIATKESGMNLLQRMIEEDEPHTENARYILVLMLERKRVLTPTAVKETEQGRMLFYENRKTGDAFIIRDPELRLDEVAGVQQEVAALLGFGGPETDRPKSSRAKAKAAAAKAAEAPAEAVTRESEPASEPQSAKEVHEENHAGL